MLLAQSYIILFFVGLSRNVSSYLNVNLPDEHWPYYFNSNKYAARHCQEDDNCTKKNFLNKDVCWGYEDFCNDVRSFSSPNCSGDPQGWTSFKEDQIKNFYNDADFGYIKQQRKELTVICQPQLIGDASLECTNYTRFCRGNNIMIDFENLLSIPEPVKYRDDVLGPGLIGGKCKLNLDMLDEMSGHKSPLQSWYAEIENFAELDQDPIKTGNCDIVIDKPTMVMKLDASINMYHHFCDFINLYITFHVNNSFSTDINIVLWDTLDYYGNFGVTWKAFTKHPVMSLRDWKGKKVCFKDLVFPHPPRMIFGMYYNMPLIPGCQNSGLFRAFNQYVLHNLDIKPSIPLKDKIRITLLSRNTLHRNILNEKELVSALNKNPNYEVKIAVYNHQMAFLKQLEITQNTDIFIGVHGAGLTHLLFLPDWAVIMELYNCDDEYCYKDLARLRGVHYMTWEKADKLKAKDEGKHPTIGAHAKFTDYTFDVEEFVRLVKIAAEHVLQHQTFQNTRPKIISKMYDEL